MLLGAVNILPLLMLAPQAEDVGLRLDVRASLDSLHACRISEDDPFPLKLTVRVDVCNRGGVPLIVPRRPGVSEAKLLAKSVENGRNGIIEASQGSTDVTAVVDDGQPRPRRQFGPTPDPEAFAIVAPDACAMETADVVLWAFRRGANASEGVIEEGTSHAMQVALLWTRALPSPATERARLAKSWIAIGELLVENSKSDWIPFDVPSWDQIRPCEVSPAHSVPSP